MAAAHVVQDLEFEVDFESEEQALDLQDRLGAFVRGPVLRILAEAFDKAGAAHERLQLERLELDLGIVEPGELEQQWADRLRERLRQVLAELAAPGPDPSQAAAKVQRGTVREGDLAALLHYLRRGVLPWQSASTDSIELAQRVWRHDRQALVDHLRGWPDAPAAARRLAGQFPVAWCAQVASALRGEVVSEDVAVGTGPLDAAGVERQLLHALRDAATAPATLPADAVPPAVACHPSSTPELRAARRRLRALLLDDAPELPDDDLGELMQLWRRLRDDDPEGLRQELEAVSSRARVRRRMAQLWPESLLRQLPHLCLGEERGRSALTVLQAGEPQAGVAARRWRWEALLRLLWASPAVQRIDAPALAQALRGRFEGRADAQPVAALRIGRDRAQATVPLLGRTYGPSPVGAPEDRGFREPPLDFPQPGEGWESLLSGVGDAVVRRHALHHAASSVLRRQRLASTASAPGFARALALWWPAREADAMAALAFAPLPRAWQRENDPAVRSEQLVAEGLRALHETPEAEWTAHGLARHWWLVLAVSLARSPGELLRALAETHADDAESDRRGAWLRWLPLPEPTPASMTDVFGAESSVADLAAALHQGDHVAVRAGWPALLATGGAAARASLRRLGESSPGREGLARHLSGPQWLQLLEVFLAPGPARAVLRAQRDLQHALQEPDAAEAEVMVRGWTVQVLLWRPAATAGDVAARLLESGARRAGMTVAALARRLPPGDDSLFRDPAAERAAVDLTRARAEAADEAGPRRRADAEAAATVIASLRGTGFPGDLAGGGRALLMALVDRESIVAREAIERELESAPSARALAEALAPEEMLRLVAWLRPADAPGLQEVWPGLRALATGPRVSAWPKVARTVLRELFEEDRPWQPDALLRRAGRAVTGAPDTAHLPWEAAPPDGPLFVGNAGVVLLAPYLPRLFGLLELADDKALAGAGAAERAVAVMQYAVTGETSAPETRLPLNKLMCGLALQAPVSRDVALTRAECEAVDGMLGAVIGHWKALGKTSVAGLRQTFLQREGRLEHKEEAWHLQVPSQTFDVLVDRLPWGFATIRYPWMPEVLHVQWR